jgi:hypothetical protein
MQPVHARATNRRSGGELRSARSLLGKPEGGTPMPKNIREEYKLAKGEFTTLRDEIRVNLHLAGLDAKDKLNELEDRFEQLAQKMDHTTEKALAEIVEAARKLRDRVRKAAHRPDAATKFN